MRELIPYIALIVDAFSVKLKLDIVSSSSTNYITMRVALMFSWRMKLRVKSPGLSTGSRLRVTRLSAVLGFLDSGSNLTIT